MDVLVIDANVCIPGKEIRYGPLRYLLVHSGKSVDLCLKCRLDHSFLAGFLGYSAPNSIAKDV